MNGRAHVHPGATLTPGKLQRIAGFRFDDPDGEVGLDCMIIESAGSLFHVPVTWRAAPMGEVGGGGPLSGVPPGRSRTGRTLAHR